MCEIGCYFQAWRHHVCARKLTWYFTGVYIIRRIIQSFTDHARFKQIKSRDISFLRQWTHTITDKKMPQENNTPFNSSAEKNADRQSWRVTCGPRNHLKKTNSSGMSVPRSVDQTISESVSQSIISQSVNQSINQSSKQASNQAINQVSKEIFTCHYPMQKHCIAQFSFKLSTKEISSITKKLEQSSW